MLRNPQGPDCADPAVIERRARLISERLGYRYERIIGWCFSQWVLGVLWAIEDGLAFAPDWLNGPNAAAEVLSRRRGSGD
jgi:streptomycin 6-kinase